MKHFEHKENFNLKTSELQAAHFPFGEYWDRFDPNK